MPGFFAAEAEASVRSLGSLLRPCVAQPLDTEVFYLMPGYNPCVPPHVREALLTRSISNDDLLTKLRLPVSITHGVDDAIVKPVAGNLHRAAMPHALLRMMAGTGHAPFWEDAVAFNRHLRLFVQSL